MSQTSATWVITGGNRGLGLEFVRDLLRSSTNIVIATTRDPEQSTSLQELHTKFPQQLHILKLDVTDEASVQTFAKEAEGVFGSHGLDYLINNAGAMKQDSPLSLSTENFLSTFKTNVLGPALLFKSLAPLLEKGNRKVVVNISSRLGSISGAKQEFGNFYTTYSSCKAALNMFTVKAACEKPNFIVFSLSPGHNKTEMGGDAAPLDPKETIPILVKFIASTTSEHSGKSWDYVGEGINEYGW